MVPWQPFTAITYIAKLVLSRGEIAWPSILDGETCNHNYCYDTYTLTKNYDSYTQYCYAEYHDLDILPVIVIVSMVYYAVVSVSLEN